jgi:serine/threonine protein kinase
MNHPNVVRLLDVVSQSGETNVEKLLTSTATGNVYMVFEFCDHDLTGLLEDGVSMSDAQVKYYLKSILGAVEHIHRQKVIHRDIKGANVLISNRGAVKVADFGLARLAINEKLDLTNRVVTLWYRAPELLLGAVHYDGAIDMWSVGCLFAELLARNHPKSFPHGASALFPGNVSELDQLTKIYEVCGTPTEAVWPGLTKMRLFNEFPFKENFPRILRQTFTKIGVTPCALDLLEKLLCYDPKARINAHDALDHKYFWEERPEPMRGEDHPTFIGNHNEYGAKKRKQQRR